MYGCHLLQRNDNDNRNGRPRWGGVVNPNHNLCRNNNQNVAAPGVRAVVRIPRHVRTLQQDLRELGFLLVGNPDGDYGRKTFEAVKEFQIYAGMEQVARVRPNAGRNLQRAAHLVAQVGQAGAVSAYVSSLESVRNAQRYTGPVSGLVNENTRNAIRHWKQHNYRCPVVVEAWTTRGRGRTATRRALFQQNGNFAVNIWRHDDVTSGRPRIYVRDFSNHYTLPRTRNANDMHVLGYYQSPTGGHPGGPNTIAPNHTWAEAEMLPEKLVGVAGNRLNQNQRSTFKVVRVVAEIECLGYFDGVNAWDRALVSMGPCHWTMGIRRGNNYQEGELGGFFAYLRSDNQNAFNDAIGDFGMRSNSSWLSNNGDDPDGIYQSSQRKYITWIATQQNNSNYQDFSTAIADCDYFKSWHWFFRYSMAGRTISGFQRGMWNMARTRIRDILECPWGAGVANVQDGNTTRPAKISDVITSEKAIAYIYRWHVYRPADMTAETQAGTRLRAALTEAMNNNRNLTWNGDPSTWANQHETALVQEIRAQVNNVPNATARNDLSQRLDYINQWPNSAGRNGRLYALTDPNDPLSEDRGSFDFDNTNLPPIPN